MNEFQRLIAYLKILYHNLTTLHRNLVKDDAWFANHKQIGKWYEEVSDQIDDLVETGIALGYLEPGIKVIRPGVFQRLLGGSAERPGRKLSVDSRVLPKRGRHDAAAEAEVPASVANKLQEYEYEWNKEANFKLAAAIGEHAHGGNVEYDDD